MKDRRFLLLFFLILLFSLSVSAFDIGILAGTTNSQTVFFYGISANTSLIISAIRVEFELFKITETEFSGMSGAIKIRPRMGKFAPFAVLGFGAEYKKFNFKFSQYNGFSFIGGGIHFYLTDMVSLRGDVRFYNFTNLNKTRLSAGIFVHI